MKGTDEQGSKLEERMRKRERERERTTLSMIFALRTKILKYEKITVIKKKKTVRK